MAKTSDHSVGHAASDVDALFQLPLAEFTAARNALAARLKKAGDKATADEVRTLVKPGVSAWAVNQIYWRERKAFDRLLDAGEQFRTAQTSQLSGRPADVRGPLEKRRDALAAASRLAAAILQDAGHPPTPDLMRRITTTLEALSTYGGLPGTPTAGRLNADVDPPGFETLAALVPRIGKARSEGPSRVLPFHQQQRTKAAKKPGRTSPAEAEQARKAQLSAARADVQEQEKTLRAARKAAEQAEGRLKTIAARAKESEKALRDAEAQKAAADARYEKAAAAADAARKEARRIAEEAEDAAQAVDDAERAVDRAEKALHALEAN